MALIVVLTEHRPMAVDNILIVESWRNVQDVSFCSDRIPHNALMLLPVLKECAPVAVVDQYPILQAGAVSQGNALRTDLERFVQNGSERDLLGLIHVAA